MDTIRLKYFVEAADAGSFTEAARRLYTSQPNISKQIAALEDELGAKLFFRENRCVRLTKVGEYLYEQVGALPKKLDQIFETARALGRCGSGALNVGLLAGQSLNRDILSRFQRFSELHPELSFTLERAGFTALREGLRGNRYDIILTLSFDIEPSPELAEAVVLPQSSALFVSRMSPLSQREDFSGAPFVAISPRESYGGYQQILRYCRKQGFEPNVVRLADSLDSLLFYVEAGVGVTILDRNTRLETDRNIRAVPMPDPDGADVVAVWLHANENPNIPRMIACLRGE